MEKNMEKFHLLYTDKNGKFKNEERLFVDFNSCELWLDKIKAKYWEIGFVDRDTTGEFFGKMAHTNANTFRGFETLDDD